MPPGSKSPLSPIQKRLSRTGGFYQLDNNSRPNDVTVDIPLDPVRTPSSSSSGVRYAPTSVASTISKEKGDDKLLDSFSGRRRIPTLDANGNASRVGYDGEEEYLNSIGKIYYKIIHFSIVTRYFIYVFPLAFFFAIPILVGVTVEPRTSIGGVPIIWQVPAIWIGLWISKLFAHYLPLLFRTFAGIASSDVRKYALVIKALEIPLSLVGWAVTSFLTFIPLTSHVPAMLRHSSGKPQHWQTGLKRLLAAATVCSVLFLVQKAFIQGLGINYHRRQFNARVKDNKRKVQLMTLLYEASRTLFPVNCPEFREEDAIIENPADTTAKKEGGAAAPQTPGTPATPGTPSNFL
ncbi:serine/threonine protein kinase, partial [Macrophomina phaseolina MS6]